MVNTQKVRKGKLPSTRQQNPIPLTFCWRAERLNIEFLKEVFTKVNFERKKSADDKNNPEAKGLIFLA